MPFENSQWDGAAVAASLSASEFCSVCLVDNNAAGAEKVKSECHFPARKTPGAPYNVGALRAITGGRGAQADFPGAEAARTRAQRLLAEYNNSQQGGRSFKPDALYRSAGFDIDLRRSAKGNPVLTGVLAPFNVWTEIRSPLEGHYLERIAPSAFVKTLQERASRIRVLFQHGRDALVGDKPIGKPLDYPRSETEQRYEVELFRASYVDDLLPGLEAGQYGTSFSFRPVKDAEVRRPERSDYNPDGLKEVTREEVVLREFGPVTFPQYEGATAALRSSTEEFVVPGLVEFLTLLGVDLPDLATRAAALDADEPDAQSEEERTTPSEDEPQHSAEESHESKEEPPSWHLSR